MKSSLLKALVTGANGMLADALCPFLKEQNHEVFETDIVTRGNIFKLDVRNFDEIQRAIKRYKPTIIFHLAAETDVDKCELNAKHAYETNSKGTENIAMSCKEFDIPMVYISTGAVFDGSKINGYIELDEPNPVNIYGKSKLKGEEVIISLLTKYYIVRAGWMIGGYKKDKKFVWKITQLLKTKKELAIVSDTVGSPTFTKDLAKGLIDIVSTGQYGIYHCVNKGICTRFDIAKKIIEFLKREDVVLKAITSDAFPQSAPRGHSEALINYKLSSIGIDNMRRWEEALKEYLEKMNYKYL